jgi:DNA repair exonuclease SbcCD nuclease subunit
MKICIIGDMHFNIKNGNKVFQKNIKKFCDDVLFPYLFKNSINVVLQSGDLFDSRTNTHSEGLKNSKECFFDKLKNNNIDLHLILGNHCKYSRISFS